MSGGGPAGPEFPTEGRHLKPLTPLNGSGVTFMLCASNEFAVVGRMPTWDAVWDRELIGLVFASFCTRRGVQRSRGWSWEIERVTL